MTRLRFGTYAYLENILIMLLEFAPEFVRTALFRVLFKRFGRDSYLDYGTYYRYAHKISIGDNTWINRGTKFYASHYIAAAEIIIGNHVAIGPDVVILSAGHNHETLNLEDIAATVRIGNDAWIGARTTILPGVSVGEGAVVGAGSVVTRDIPPWTIAVGNPARVIKKRVIRSENGDGEGASGTITTSA